MRFVAAWLAGMALAVLASCGGPDTTAAPNGNAGGGVDAVLDRLESPPWPDPFDMLALPADRSYLVLAQVPPPVAFDLSSTAAAQAALHLLATEPWRILRAGSALGHVIVGWSCADGHRGLAAKIGGGDGALIEMLRTGWGLSAAFSTYTDGQLIGPDEFDPGHLAILREGRGHLVATEVTAADCAALRADLAAYLGHPNAPASRYGLLGPVAAMEGDGCIGFALYLAGEGGMLPGLAGAFDRRVPLNSAFMGTGTAVPPLVEPFRPVADDGTCPGPVALPDLLSGPWDAGTDLGQITVPDAELLFAGLAALRTSGGLPSDWHNRRSLPATDPDVARAQAAVLFWAQGWPVWRQMRRGPLWAMVLEQW